MPQSRQHAASGDPFEHDLARNVQVEHHVDRALAGDAIERLGLLDRAREAVEDVAAGARIGSAEALVDQTDHDLVTDEPAGVHHLLGHHAELGAFTHGRAQHVAGRDVRYDEVPGQPHALRALAGTLSPEDDEAGAGDHAGPTSGIPRSCAA